MGSELQTTALKARTRSSVREANFALLAHLRTRNRRMLRAPAVRGRGHNVGVRVIVDDVRLYFDIEGCGLEAQGDATADAGAVAWRPRCRPQLLQAGVLRDGRCRAGDLPRSAWLGPLRPRRPIQLDVVPVGRGHCTVLWCPRDRVPAAGWHFQWRACRGGMRCATSCTGRGDRSRLHAVRVRTRRELGRFRAPRRRSRPRGRGPFPRRRPKARGPRGAENRGDAPLRERI